MTKATESQAPLWHNAGSVSDLIRMGKFFHHGLTLEESIAKHLQHAFEKGFEHGRRVDPTSENARLRKALLDRVMVWDDPHTRDFRVCDLCGVKELERHKSTCALAWDGQQG